MQNTRFCTDCGVGFPATNQFFRARKDGKGGLNARCKDCAHIRDRKDRVKNKDSISKSSKKYRDTHKESASQYYQTNKEYIGVIKKRYRSENREACSIRDKKYNQANKESIAIQRRQYQIDNKESIDIYQKWWRNVHKEEMKVYRREYRKRPDVIIRRKLRYKEHQSVYMVTYRLANKSRIAETGRMYQQGHREEINIKSQKRRARILKLPHTLSMEQWKSIRDYFNNKCAYCGKEKPLTQEHFVAVTKGGEYTHNNIIPACQSCNCRKNNISFFEWYPKQPYYSKKREQKILKFLHYEKKTHNQQLALM